MPPHRPVPSRPRRWAACLVVATLAAAPCLWDADTLDDELRGLPEAFDLVVGGWHRHGRAYYEERVRRLLAQPSLSLAEHDDLAVAFEHLGERDRAIEVMAAKRAALGAAPAAEPLYRCHANLGTFLAHAGRYDEALAELRRAIAIEPAAHFGRESFQIELIEYVVAATADPALWRRGSFLLHAGHSLHALPWLSWVRAPDPSSDVVPEATGPRLAFDRGYTAVAGMLRYGGREGPELYRALAELFLAEGHLNLAWWSLQRAIERGHPAADVLAAGVAKVESHWRQAKEHVTSSHAPPSLRAYREHRDAADRWLAAFQRLEAAAIARGEDVRGDDALRALLDAADAEVPRPGLPWRLPLRPWLVGTAAAALLLGLVLDRRRRDRRTAIASGRP